MTYNISIHSDWTINQVVDHIIDQKVEECRGNVSEAAKQLGITRKTIYNRRKMRIIRGTNNGQ